MYDPMDIAARRLSIEMAGNMFNALVGTLQPKDSEAAASLYKECIAHTIKLDREAAEAIQKHR